MKDLSEIRSDNPGRGFEFPGAFEVTAVGKAHAGLEERIAQIVAAQGVTVLDGSLRTRPSAEGNYVSVSVTFTCPSREKFEAVHAALRADSAVRWTL